jgi:hypothetical protein
MGGEQMSQNYQQELENEIFEHYGFKKNIFRKFSIEIFLFFSQGI